MVQFFSIVLLTLQLTHESSSYYLFKIFPASFSLKLSRRNQKSEVFSRTLGLRLCRDGFIRTNSISLSSTNNGDSLYTAPTGEPDTVSSVVKPILNNEVPVDKLDEDDTNTDDAEDDDDVWDLPFERLDTSQSKKQKRRQQKENERLQDEETGTSTVETGIRETDLTQNRDLDLILTERATRFYDPKLLGVEKEKCILIAVDTKLEERRSVGQSAERRKVIY